MHKGGSFLPEIIATRAGIRAEADREGSALLWRSATAAEHCRTSYCVVPIADHHSIKLVQFAAAAATTLRQVANSWVAHTFCLLRPLQWQRRPGCF